MRSFVLCCVALACLVLQVPEAGAKTHTFDELIEIIDGPKRKYDFVDKIDAFDELARLNDMRTVKELIRRLDKDWGHLALWALVEMRVPGSEPLLIKALASPDEWRRSLLCVALGRLGGDKAVAALVGRIDKDSEKWVRRQAIHALRHDAQARPTGPAVRGLMRAMESPELVSSARRVLWTLRDLRSGPLVRKGLLNASKEVRGLAADWIRSRNDSGSTDALFKLLKKEPEDEVRTKAMLALAMVHPQSRATEVATLLTKGLSKADPSKALSALLRTLRHRTRAFPPKVAASIATSLHRLFQHTDKELARTAVLAAQYLGHASSASRVLPLLKSSDRYMRQAAIAAVGNCMSKAGEGKALLQAIENPDGQHSALQTYSREIRKRKGVAKLVIAGLNSSSVHVRRATAKLLQRQEDPTSAKALIRALKKESDRKTAEDLSRALKTTATIGSLSSMAPLLVQKQGNRERENRHLAKAFVLVDRHQGFKASRSIITQGGTAALALLGATPGFDGDEAMYQWAATSNDKNLRGRAAGKLRSVASLASMGILCKLLGDSDSNTRLQAAKSLGESNRAGAARCLIGALGVKHEGLLSKESLFTALGRLSGEKFGKDEAAWKSWQKKNMGLGRGIPGLAVALQSGTRERVMMAAFQIQRLPSQQVRRLTPALQDALKSERQRRARIVLIDAIAKGRSPSAAVLLRKDLDKVHDSQELIARAKALLVLDDPTGRDLLLTKFEDKNFRDREMVGAALAQMKK